MSNSPLTMKKHSKRPLVCPPTPGTKEPIQWVVEGELAYAKRPGFGTWPVPAKVVDQWLENIRRLGIRSLIVLLSDNEVFEYYPDLGLFLTEYYVDAGFHVRAVPQEDFRGRVALPILRARVREAFETLPKPVLIHCDEGSERTQLAIRAICHGRQNAGAKPGDPGVKRRSRA